LVVTLGWIHRRFWLMFPLTASRHKLAA
jgi:hypothetical protein